MEMLSLTSALDKSCAASTLAWWAEAGVETLVGETPRNWRAESPKVAPRQTTVTLASTPVAPIAKPAAPLPDTLEGFTAWFLSADLPGAGPASQRIAPSGDAAAKLMILVDMPEAEDAMSRRLLSGEAGALFDRMLNALGFDLSLIHI